MGMILTVSTLLYVALYQIRQIAGRDERPDARK